LWPRV